jgi:hypothetical protein
MVPEFEQTISATGGEDLLGSGVPLYLIAVLDMSWKGKEQLPDFGCADMQNAIQPSSDEQRILIGALHRNNFGLPRNGPGFTLADLPKGYFTIACPE